MASLELVTELDCPPERAIALSLDLGVELASGARYRAHVVGGSVCDHSGIAVGETVTWQLWMWGLPLRHTSVISELDPPRRFVDDMVSGLFSEYRHEHVFEPLPGGRCLMRDRARYRAPLGPLGTLADALFVRRRMLRLLFERNAEIARRARSRVG